MILLPFPGMARAGTAPAGPLITQAWNPATKSAAAVLSVSDRRLTANTGAAGTYASAKSLAGITGLAYFSCQMGSDASGAVVAFGVIDSTVDLTTGSAWVGQTTLSVGAYGPNGAVYFNGTTSVGVGAVNATDQIEIAVRVSTRRVWIRQNGGAWAGGGDPAADTTPTATLSGSGGLFLAATVAKSGASAIRYTELHPDAGTTTGSAPSGFTAANWV